MTSLIDTTDDGNEIADPDHLWVCCACGKTSESRYGIAGTRSHGWDESCMLNAQLFAKNRLVFSPGGRVTEVKPK